MLKIFLLINDPLRLSRVCHVWRIIAAEHSTLWTDISIDNRHHPPSTFLLRSKSLPLSVSTKDCCDNDCGKCIASIQLTLHHASRIQCFELKVSDATTPFIQEWLSNLNPTILTSLALIRAQVLDPGSQLLAVPMFLTNNFQVLQSLTLSSIPIRAPNTAILAKLTHLSLSTQDFRSQYNYLPIREMLHVLVQCPKLEKLAIEAKSAFYGPESLPNHTFKFRNLSAVYLDHVNTRVCVYFVNVKALGVLFINFTIYSLIKILKKSPSGLIN